MQHFGLKEAINPPNGPDFKMVQFAPPEISNNGSHILYVDYMCITHQSHLKNSLYFGLFGNNGLND